MWAFAEQFGESQQGVLPDELEWSELFVGVCVCVSESYAFVSCGDTKAEADASVWAFAEFGWQPLVGDLSHE